MLPLTHAFHGLRQQVAHFHRAIQRLLSLLGVTGGHLPSQLFPRRRASWLLAILVNQDHPPGQSTQ